MIPTAITATDITTCEKESLLHLWHQRFYDEKERLVSEVEASDLVAYDNQNWRKMMVDKIAKCTVSMKRIERRVITLGFAPILTRQSGQRAVIKELLAQNERLKAELAALKRMRRAA